MEFREILLQNMETLPVFIKHLIFINKLVYLKAFFF